MKLSEQRRWALLTAPEDEDDWSDCDVTEAGRVALGVIYQQGVMLHDGDRDCTGFDVVWDAVARLLTEAGYPTQMGRHRLWLYMVEAA